MTAGEADLLIDAEITRARLEILVAEADPALLLRLGNLIFSRPCLNRLALFGSNIQLDNPINGETQ